MMEAPPIKVGQVVETLDQLRKDRAGLETHLT
jgi:hypothetical protein